MNSTAWVQCVSVTIHNSAVQNSNHWLGFPTASRMKGSSRVLVRTADVYVAQSTDNFQTSCWFDSFHFFALQPLPLYSGPGLSQPSPIKAVISCLSARLSASEWEIWWKPSSMQTLIDSSPPPTDPPVSVSSHLFSSSHDFLCLCLPVPLCVSLYYPCGPTGPNCRGYNPKWCH